MGRQACSRRASSWLFDDRDLAEIRAPEQFPGERLIVCRNPLLADERARKRDALLAATEADLVRIEARLHRKTATGKTAAEIGLAVGAVLHRRKMAKHFILEISDGALSWRRDTDLDQAKAERSSPVVKTEPSELSKAKMTSKLNRGCLPVMAFSTLLDHLGTLARNTVTAPHHGDHRFTLYTKPTPIQAQTFDYLHIDPTRVQ